jgi:hypothetical protein
VVSPQFCTILMDREEITPLAILTDNLTVTRAVIVADYKNVRVSVVRVTNMQGSLLG